MNWPSTMPLVLAAGLAAPLAWHCWRRRETPGAMPLGVMALGVMVWTAATAVYLHLTSPAAQGWWTAVSFTGIVALPPAWLAFALRFTGRSFRFGKGALGLAVAIGLVMVALVATNGWHLWVWHNVTRNGQVRSAPGVVYVAFVIYGHLLSLAGIGLLIEKALASAAVFHRQQGIMIAAGLLPILTNLLYELGVIPLQTDPTPLGFLISILLVWWGLFRMDLLDLIPVAHGVLLNTMNDGLLVIDARERILEMNRAAPAMLEGLAPKALGRPAGEALKLWAELREMCRPEGPGRIELTIPREPHPLVLEASATPISSPHGPPKGYLLLFRDITERRRTELEREALIVELRAALGQVKTLSGLLPICASCKKIRDKADQWHSIEAYLTQHAEAHFTHGLCPDCVKRFFPG